ncbi:acid shock protein precursor [Salmonella enterica subsp. arizonae]|uniref:Acid shock protein n=1 Tax=Salmonella enterica subsp. arizonae TaxID=59203 RepID=A0A379S780_SALER|nr:acid shock protein precursor [Salmonella enterica subsp. arizonae]
MKKVLALVVAAAMGLSSAAFAAETATPAKTAAPAKTTQHHKKQHKSSIKPLNKKRRRLKNIRKKMAKRQPKPRQNQLLNRLHKS